jgi:integrase
MASIKFYLTRPNSQAETSIFFLLNYGAYEIVSGKKKYLPFKYYTNETILPIYWDAKQGKAASKDDKSKNQKRYPEYPEFNARLTDIESIALKTIRRLEDTGAKIANEVLKREFDILWKDWKDQTEDVTNHMEFMSYVEHFIKTSNRREGTKKSYTRSFRDYREYEAKRKTRITFDRVDIDFYNDFVKFLKSKQYAPNTIGCRIKNLKTFLSNAKEAGLPVLDDFKKKAFAKPREETDAVYLNENELMKMYSLNLENNPKLDRVRDLFLIGAYTGLRFSDLSQLNKNDIQTNTIAVRTIKTGTQVVIPIHPVVRAILGKYEGILPKAMSNQKFNDYIKDTARLAGIDCPVKVEYTKGDMKVKKSEPKYNLVTSHTARRSFATNAFLSDIPAISIMEITGHKTESAFMRYIKISQEDNARKLISHKFFTGMAAV